MRKLGLRLRISLVKMVTSLVLIAIIYSNCVAAIGLMLGRWYGVHEWDDDYVEGL